MIIHTIIQILELIKIIKNDIPKELVSINCGQISRKYSKETIDGMSYSNIMIKYNISSKGTVHYIIHKEYTLYKTYPKRYRVL